MAAEITLARMMPRKKVLNDKGEKFCHDHNNGEGAWLHLDNFKSECKICDACNYKKVKALRAKREEERKMWGI